MLNHKELGSFQTLALEFRKLMAASKKTDNCHASMCTSLFALLGATGGLHTKMMLRYSHLLYCVQVQFHFQLTYDVHTLFQNVCA